MTGVAKLPPCRCKTDLRWLVSDPTIRAPSSTYVEAETMFSPLMTWSAMNDALGERMSASTTTWLPRRPFRQDNTRVSRALGCTATQILDRRHGTAAIESITSAESACFMMAWAFVPWKANELMPTCMAASCDMPVELRRPSQNDVPDFALCISIIVWMWLLTRLRCGMPCTTALDTATVAWTSPVAPAPASVWPIQALAVLADKNDLLDGWSIRTALAAPSSIGSPSGVPVPCIWRLDTSPGRVPLNLSPERMTSDWLGPFGAVSDAELPSWLTAVLTMYAMTSWSALLLLP